MNTIALIGRLTKDVEVRYSQGENSTAIASFTLAVDRRFKKDGQQNTDFIYCKAFGKTAEVMQKYTGKGSKVGVQGRLQIDNYEDKDGNKRTSANVIVEQLTFCDSKGDGTDKSNTAEKQDAKSDGDSEFVNLTYVDEAELPF